MDLLNVKGLQALDPQAPVVMVNLMRFRERSLDGDGSGWDAYLRYSALTVPMIKARGGTLLWTGDAKAVALGPRGRQSMGLSGAGVLSDVAAFIDMMTSEDYEQRCDPAPHQRLRRARDHRDQGGVQQVQDGVDCAARINAAASCSAEARHPVRRGFWLSCGCRNTALIARAHCAQVDAMSASRPQNFRTRSGVISLIERMPSSARSRSISAFSSVIARCTPASPPAIAA